MDTDNSEIISVDITDVVKEQLAMMGLLKKASRLAVVGQPLSLTQDECDMLRTALPRQPEHISLLGPSTLSTATPGR